MKYLPLTDLHLKIFSMASHRMRQNATDLEATPEFTLENAVGNCIRKTVEEDYQYAAVLDDLVKRYKD